MAWPQTVDAEKGKHAGSLSSPVLTLLFNLVQTAHPRQLSVAAHAHTPRQSLEIWWNSVSFLTQGCTEHSLDVPVLQFCPLRNCRNPITLPHGAGCRL